jgi:RimJ/RimL family protein N-acetyltransferase
LEGAFAALEPLTMARHGDPLFAASSAPGADERFRYLWESPPESREAFEAWGARAEHTDDPLFFAVVDRATGRAEGRQALMRIEPAHGVIEIGHILWGPAIARTRVATEAFYLAAHHVFDTLGYRRFEWKCDNRNEPSKRAAQRFGFTAEGVFRQHMVTKGRNRDTAWFSIVDVEWPRLRAAFEAWLAPENFEGTGQQRRTLQSFMEN